jgi:site-specific recombinase XerD
MARTLRAAGWKAGVRPYELRHSTGIALSDAGVDLADIGGFLGHTDLRTTRSTYVPIRQGRMQRASQALDGRFKGWKTGTATGTPDKSTT